MTPRIGELLALAATAAALVAFVPGIRATARSRGSPEVAARAAGFALAGTLALLGAWLFLTLSSCTGILRAWEGHVLSGFEEEFRAGTALAASGAGRFLWNKGLLSTGHDSLFYGFPTLLLFRAAGVSVFTLRASAAFATLAGIALAFFWAKRTFGPGTAALLAAVLAVNPCVLLYARYGTSVAGTLLACWLALALAWRLLGRAAPSALDGVAAALAIFLLTLQYSPGRLLALFLLVFVPGVLLFRRSRPRPTKAVAAFLAVAAAVSLFEWNRDRGSLFLEAGGEHFVAFLRAPETLRYYFAGQDAEAPNDAVELAVDLVKMNGPAFLRLSAPVALQSERGTGAAWDPPRLPLVFAPSLPFLLLGLAVSLRAAVRDWRHLLLVGGAAAIAVPLLLTTRCDLPRLSCLVPFLAVWTALGLAAANRALGAAGCPRSITAALGAVWLAASAWTAGATLTYAGATPDAPISRSIAAALGPEPGPVCLGIDGDERDVSLARIALLDRLRSRPGFPPTLMERVVREELERDPAGHPAALQALSAAANESPVLLGPANAFARLRPLLPAAGLAATETGTGDFRLLRIENVRTRGPGPP